MDPNWKSRKKSVVEKKGIFYAHIQPTFIINLKWKIFFGGTCLIFLFWKGNPAAQCGKKQKYALTTQIRETNVFTKEVTKAMVSRKVFSLRVNFLFFHTVCSMLLFFNSMCVYPFFFSLKTFVDDALCWTKSLLRVVEIWHHWIVDKHGKTFSIPTIFPFVVGAMLSDVCRSICKTILY